MTTAAPTHTPSQGDPTEALTQILLLARRLVEDLHVRINYGTVEGGWPFAYQAETRTLTIRGDAPRGLSLLAMQQTFNLLVIGPQACDGVTLDLTPALALVPRAT